MHVRSKTWESSILKQEMEKLEKDSSESKEQKWQMKDG